jgi:hypothetical protein
MPFKRTWRAPGPETVSQHRSGGGLLRFRNQLEGRRLRRPRYRAEQSPLLGFWLS